MAKYPKEILKDPILAKMAETVNLKELVPDNHIVYILLKAIVSQQLSTKAADTIFKRFMGIYDHQIPDSQSILDTDTEAMRAVGLSYQKAGYIKNIAQFDLDFGLNYAKIDKMGDEELIEYLTQIKGVGRWTTEMVLIFELARPDVFPIDDLGIRQQIIKYWSVTETNKKKLNEELTKIAENWRPHRSLACRLLWGFKDKK